MDSMESNAWRSGNVWLCTKTDHCSQWVESRARWWVLIMEELEMEPTAWCCWGVLPLRVDSTLRMTIHTGCRSWSTVHRMGAPYMQIMLEPTAFGLHILMAYLWCLVRRFSSFLLDLTGQLSLIRQPHHGSVHDCSKNSSVVEQDPWALITVVSSL